MYVIVIGLLLAVVGYAGYAVYGSFAPSFTTLANDVTEVTSSGTATNGESRVRVNTPVQHARIASPIIITGEAVGPWYFEGSFGISILDSAGNSIAEGAATAKDDWMQEGYVPFSAAIYFNKPESSTGVIRIHKANPSGLPSNEASIDIPVRF